jgi:hypothetical protein
LLVHLHHLLAMAGLRLASAKCLRGCANNAGARANVRMSRTPFTFIAVSPLPSFVETSIGSRFWLSICIRRHNKRIWQPKETFAPRKSKYGSSSTRSPPQCGARLGYLFTIGSLHLGFWGGILAIILWPYYLAAHFSAVGCLCAVAEERSTEAGPTLGRDSSTHCLSVRSLLRSWYGCGVPETAALYEICEK